MADQVLLPERTDLISEKGLPTQRFHAWMERLTDTVNTGLVRVVFVESIDDFPAVRSGVIKPDAGVLYIVNTFVSMGTVVFDTDGNDFLVIGHNNLHDGLVYSGTGTFITAGNEINSADLSFISTSGGQWIEYDGDNTHNVVLNGCNVIGFTDLGEVADILTFAAFITQWQGFGKGFLFTGAGNDAFFSTSCTYIAASNVGTILDFGTAVFNAILIETGRIETFAGGQIGINGAANDANVTVRGAITDVVFEGPGTHVNGIANDDLRWRFLSNFGNMGTEDTVVHGAMTMQNNATTTPIAGGWPQKTLGTRVTGNLSRFTFNADGTLTYIGLEDIRLTGIINCSPSIASGANQIIKLYPAVNGSILSAFASTVKLNVGDVRSVTIPYEAAISTGDTLDLWVDNTSGGISVLIVSEKHIADGF